MIGPLPFIGEFGLLARLVIGGIHIITSCLEAGIHYRKILIGKRHIDHEIGFDPPHQSNRGFDIVGIDLCDIDIRIAQRCNLFT
ncbi:MAG: Uncharacterised protein [Hyphomonas sp. TMED17]|nr:MAG: Uncharacterised protein [Hyphomonas sp. TMED17]